MHTHTSSNSKTKSKTPQQRTYEAQCRNASKCVWCSECAAYMLYESYAVRVSEGIKLMSKNNTIYSKRSRFSIQKECIEKCLNSTIFWVCHVSGCASVMDQNYTTACDRDNFFFLENIFYDVFLRFYTDCIWTKKCNGKCLDRPKNKRSTFRASMRYNQTIFRWKISFAMEAKQHPLNIQSLVEFKLSLSLWFSDWTSKKEPISADFHYVNCRHMTQLH